MQPASAHTARSIAIHPVTSTQIGSLKLGKPRKRPVVACWECRQRSRSLLAAVPPHRRLLRPLFAEKPPGPESELAPEKYIEPSTSGRDSSAEKEQAEETTGVRIALGMLNFYKSAISPLMAPACRFQPTCSAYAMDAYKKFGVGKGTLLTAWRLARCNPWGGSGYDPVKWPPPGFDSFT